MLVLTKETSMATKPLISFRIQPEIDKELKERASRSRTTLSRLVANLVEDHLAAEKADQQARSAA
jgi:hypothetical protein